MSKMGTNAGLEVGISRLVVERKAVELASGWCCCETKRGTVVNVYSQKVQPDGGLLSDV